MAAFHAHSPPTSPDQTDSHQPRPSATIQQRKASNCRGRAHGGTDHAPNCAAANGPCAIGSAQPAGDPAQSACVVRLPSRPRDSCSSGAQIPTGALRRRHDGVPGAAVCASPGGRVAGCHVVVHGRLVRRPCTGPDVSSSAHGQPWSGRPQVRPRTSCPHRDRGRGLVVGGRVGDDGFSQGQQHPVLTWEFDHVPWQAGLEQ